jgi:hypothetical protein
VTAASAPANSRWLCVTWPPADGLAQRLPADDDDACEMATMLAHAIAPARRATATWQVREAARNPLSAAHQG